MSPRVVRITAISAAVVLLLVLAYFLHDLGGGHRIINTAGEITFVSDRQSPGYKHIWIMDSDGSHARELTRGNDNDTDPAFSPDGSQIAFVSDRTGQQEIDVMEADGTGQHTVTIGSDSKSDPQFSADGSQIAFLTRGTLVTLDLSSNQTTTELPSQDSATATATSKLAEMGKFPVSTFWWQPPSDPKTQNRLLAAVQESDTGDVKALSLFPNPEQPYEYTDLVVRAPAQVTSAARPFNDQDVGQTLNISGGSGFLSGTYNIINVSNGIAALDNPCGSAGSTGGAAELSRPTAMFLAQAADLSCSWSPEGGTLAVAATGLPGPGGKSFSDILLFDKDGKPMQPPMTPQPGAIFGPHEIAFSADGTEIAYVVWNQPDVAHRNVLGLAVVPVDGSSKPKPLVKGAVSNIRWSPEGAPIVYCMPQTNDPNKEDIWSVDPSGTSKVNLTNGQGDNSEPVFSPAIPKVSGQ